MYKKRITALVCLLALLLTMPVKAYAFSADAGVERLAAAPRMTYIYDAKCTLNIQNGVASVNAFVMGYPDTATKCEITVELQQKSLLFWNPVETWSDSQAGRRAAINESVSVSAGKSYRTVTTVTVWSGTESESRTLTSATYSA